MLSKAQRVALFNLCTILNLTTYDPALRVTTLQLRDLICKNTLNPKHNACSFDLTEKQRKILDTPAIRSVSQKYANA